MQIITQLREILKGIDSQECLDDDGWWETITGAEFGAAKLQEIEELVRPLAESHGRLLEELQALVYEASARGADLCLVPSKRAITAAEQLTKEDA